jgi:hypothetical protein
VNSLLFQCTMSTKQHIYIYILKLLLISIIANSDVADNQLTKLSTLGHYIERFGRMWKDVERSVRGTF